jgi:small subunit ribosomal protein S1
MTEENKNALENEGVNSENQVETSSHSEENQNFETPENVENQESEHQPDSSEIIEKEQEVVEPETSVEEVVVEHEPEIVAQDHQQETPKEEVEAEVEVHEEVQQIEESFNEIVTPDETLNAIEASIEDDEFDWDSFEKGVTKQENANRTEMERLYEASFSNIEDNQIIKGKVVAITPKDVVLNIGFKSDGSVPLSEVKYMPDLKIGDEIEVLVESKEDASGQLVISHKKALAESSWDKIVAIHESGEIIKGYVKDRTRGGMVVEIMGLEAFLPGSQLDIKPIKDYDMYVHTTMDLKVVKLNPTFRNIVVSHKAIIESGLELQKLEILSKLEKGQILEGVVKNLTSFGIFVDLGGVDGLVHITDVSWGRITHPEEILNVGDTINVVVLEYDEDKKRISLGMKQLTPHPWDTLPEDIQEGSRVMGKVVNMEDYGAFVEIATGVEGLVHVSEMSWSTHLKSPQEYVKLGDEVEVVVLAIDRDERKLSLGIKQLAIDPWETVEERYPINSKHNAVVRSMTNFGLFVELEPGIDGLVHISDFSWTKKYSHPAEFTKVGENLDVLVLAIEKENRRLSLGHKQLEEDPWDTFESIYLEGSLHQGVILTIDDKGATVALAYGVEAYAPKRHLAKADKSKPRVDETLDFKVIEFDKANRKIFLSHTDIWKEEERAKREVEDTTKTGAPKKGKDKKPKTSSGDKATTLADELDILAQLKSKMMLDDKAKQKAAMDKLEKKDSSSEDEE